MKLGRDEVLMTNTCASAFHQIRTGVDRGRGKIGQTPERFIRNVAILIFLLGGGLTSEA